jgi:AraC-like DNA-binding protein
MIKEEIFEKLSTESEYGINFLNTDCPYLDVPWHFHPETEIIYIEKGSGTRFVGDHSEAFEEGDIGLVGPNLPHVWRSDPIYRENIPGLTAHVQVVHFHDSILKGPLAKLTEMQGINQLLFESQFGIKFYGSARESIEFQMKALIKSTGIEKLLQLLKILDFMSVTDEKQLLASSGYSKIRKSADFDRFDKAHRFMIDNFQKNISLETVSDIIGMTPTSFCRYFKKRTKKTFHAVLNEIRIGHACKLLIEGKMNISGLAYESGFNNISNFNEQFKKLKGISPSQYIKNRKNISVVTEINI